MASKASEFGNKFMPVNLYKFFQKNSVFTTTPKDQKYINNDVLISFIHGDLKPFFDLPSDEKQHYVDNLIMTQPKRPTFKVVLLELSHATNLIQEFYSLKIKKNKNVNSTSLHHITIHSGKILIQASETDFSLWHVPKGNLRDKDIEFISDHTDYYIILISPNDNAISSIKNFMSQIRDKSMQGRFFIVNQTLSNHEENKRIEISYSDHHGDTTKTYHENCYLVYSKSLKYVLNCLVDDYQNLNEKEALRPGKF